MMDYFRAATGVAPRVHAICLAVVILRASAQAQDVQSLLNSTSVTCTDSAGRPQFCAPWPTEEIVPDVTSVMLSATSTCDPNDTATEQCVDGVCSGRFCPDNVTVENLLSRGAEWRSEPFNSTSEVVTIDIDLGRPYILFTIALEFPSGTAPERLRLERASSENASYSLLTETFNSSDVADDNLTAVVTNATAYSALLASAAGVRRLASNATTQHLRLRFLEAGVNVTAATPGGGNASYFYALSAVTLTGLCQCNGHASSCPMGECDCEHGTAGTDCSTCNNTNSSTTSVAASRASGAGICHDLTTDEIIIIACCGGGGLLILLVILVACCCVRKRNGGGGGGLKEEITVIDATGLHHIVLKNRGYKEDGYDTNTGTKLMPQGDR